MLLPGHYVHINDVVCFVVDLLVLGHNLQMLRVIKSPAELELMRQSSSVAAQSLSKVSPVGWGWGGVSHP